MSYDDYFRKLNFSGVSSSIDGMKEKEVSKLTSDVNSRFTPKIDSLQSSIDTLTSDEYSKSTLDNAIETASTSLGGVMSTGGIIKKLMKNKKGESKEGNVKGESKGNEKDESKGGEEPAEQESESTDAAPQEASVEEAGSEIPDSIPTMAEQPQTFSDAFNSVKQAFSSDTQVTDTPLPQSQVEVPDTELGSGTMNTTEPAGSGSGDIEMRTFSGNDGVDSSAPEMTGTGQSAPGSEIEMRTFSSNVEEGAADAGEAAIESATTIGTEAGINAGIDAGIDAGVEGGIAAASIGLDATGILAPLGILLELGGLFSAV